MSGEKRKVSCTANAGRMSAADVLQYAVDHDMFDVGDMRKQIEMRRREEYLQMHPYKIWEDKNGVWHTYLPDEQKKRVPRKRSTKEELEDVVISFWMNEEKNPTVRDVFEEWAAGKLATKEITKPTYDRYWCDFNRFFVEFGKRKIKNITEIEIEDFILNAIGEFSLTSKAFSNLRTIVYGVFKRAKKKRLVAFSITELVNDTEISRKSFKKVVKEDYQEVFMEDENAVVQQYLTEHPDVVNLGILLMFGTGLRVGELVALMPEDIEKNVIRVRRTETRYRGDDQKYVYMIKETPKTLAGIRSVIIPGGYMWIIDRLRQLNPDGEYLLMSEGKRIHTYSVRNRLSRVCRNTHVYKKSPHKIRKTYGTILMDNEVDSTLVISQMGHTNILCTEKHYHRNRKDIERKTSVIDGISEFAVNAAEEKRYQTPEHMSDTLFDTLQRKRSRKPSVYAASRSR